jgi:hypothetical protein
MGNTRAAGGDALSVLGGKADILNPRSSVRFWPKADISFASVKRLYKHNSGPQDEQGDGEMSKNGNKIAVVGGASRVGCAAMTVTAA